MKRKGQSIIEYSVLVAAAAVALTAMSQYVYRAINARLKQVQEEVVDSPEPGVTVPAPPAGP